MEQILINTEWRRIAVKPYGLIKLQNLSVLGGAVVTVHIGNIPLVDTGGFVLKDDNIFETIIADDDIYVKANKTASIAYQYTPMERKYPFYTNITTHDERVVNGSTSFEVVGMHTLVVQNIGTTVLKMALNPADNTDGQGFTLEPNKHIGFDLISNTTCRIYGNGKVSTLITSLINREAVRGPIGLTGPAGPKGDRGDTGATGAIGPKGDKGDRGLTGPQGPQGVQGIKGDKGDTGEKGATGNTGPKGDTGAQGIKGFDGLSAYEIAIKNGYVGTESEWIESVKGVKGDKGDKGDQGEVGPIGPQGLTGLTGPVGPRGATGPVGPIGPEGPQGIQGVKGEKGDTGSIGLTGPQGSPGPKGDMGIQGPMGERGPIGLTGKPGAIGPKGLSAYEVWLTMGHTGTENDFYNWIGTLVQLPAGLFNRPIHLGTTNLNIHTSPNIYYQDANANTSSALNYPTNQAGSLMVLRSAGVTQIYCVYNSSRMFIRSVYGGTWTAWHEMYGTHNFSPGNYYTKTETNNLLNGKANSSHGNHVPGTEAANNSRFLRNDNTWQTVTPGNIGAYTKDEVDNGLAGKLDNSHNNASTHKNWGEFSTNGGQDFMGRGKRCLVATTGNLIINYAADFTAVDIQSNLYTTRAYNAVYNDYAEYFPKRLGYVTEPGDIIAIDMNSDDENYILADIDNSVVVGVHTDEYAYLIGGEQAPEGEDQSKYNEDRYIPIGLAGRLKVKFKGIAKKGTRVVASNIPGVGREYNPRLDSTKDIIGVIVENNNEEGIRRIRMLIK